MVDEFLIKEVIRYYPELWYKVEYIVDEHMIRFRAFKIDALDEQNIEDSEISELLDTSGFIKWDGCIEIGHNAHYCNIEFAEQYFKLIKEIYKFNAENDREGE